MQGLHSFYLASGRLLMSFSGSFNLASGDLMSFSGYQTVTFSGMKNANIFHLLGVLVL